MSSRFSICTIPSVVKFLSNVGVLNLFAPSVNSKFGLGRVLALTKKQVSKRFDGKGNPISDQNDMLGSFVRHGLNQDECEQESVLQLAAGSDTTATGLRGTLLCIMTNSRVYSKLVSEIDESIRSRKISPDMEDVICDEEARQLPYLQACIKEGLRWFVP